MARRFITLLRGEDGQGTTEYSLALLMIVLVVILVASPMINTSLNNIYAYVVDVMAKASE
jgi:uncharacterized protein (UPF0333 family)